MCQLELFEKIITVKTISCQGNKVFYLDFCDVKVFILNQSKELKLWLYVDGVHMN